MSRNITIQEGDVARIFTTNKLKTDLAGGGTCLWVPRGDVQLGTKSITENGTYKASEDDLYGYSQVMVNVQGGGDTITGKDPRTGEETVVGTDPTTGDLVITVAPAEIRVTTPPTNPYGTYTDGQIITKDGMVVKAYLASGELYPGLPNGNVPNGEITLTPGIAAYDVNTDYANVTADIDTSPVGQPISSRYVAQVMGNPSYPLVEIEAYRPMAAIMNTSVPDNVGNARFYCIIATDQAGAVVEKATRHTRDDRIYVDEKQADHSYTYDGKTVYYALDARNSYYTSGTGFTPVAGGYPSSQIPVDAIAWALLYGEYTQRGSHQTITVEWPRPRDGKVLETTFEILVAPGYTPNGDE